MFILSVVTFNRKDILRQTLEVLERTCPEEHRIIITDNGSNDGTPDMLREMDAQGRLEAYLLPENIGVARARNAHWPECIGHDAVKIDDKVLMITPGWLTACKLQSEIHHALIGFPYDPTVQHLYRFAPIIDYWPHPGQHKEGEGGPMTYIPGEVSKILGAWDELPGCLYGWEEILYNHRARLMGWNYGFSLRIPHSILAQASLAGREHAMAHHADHMQRYKEYENAERDVFIDPEDTDGRKAWESALGIIRVTEAEWQNG